MKTINEITEENIESVIKKMNTNLDIEYVKKNIDIKYISKLIVRVQHLLDEIGIQRYKNMLIEEEIESLLNQ